MIRRYVIVAGVIAALLLLVIAALHYPGGSQADSNSVGYDWKNNYISNLFSETAMNGAVSGSRPWAIGTVICLSVSFALFFTGFSKKVPSKSGAAIIKYAGLGSMLANVFVVTSYHDAIVRISGILLMVSMVYISIFVLTSRLLLLKILSIINLVVFYGCNYFYYTRMHLEWLPVIQKAVLLTAIVWMLCLEYFTTAADFPVKKRN